MLHADGFDFEILSCS